MTKLKSLALAAVVGLGFTGAASAQVFPGPFGSHTRSDAYPRPLMANGAVVSNGYMAEPEDFQRGRLVREQQERLLGVPQAPGFYRW